MKLLVTPYVGVWIETFDLSSKKLFTAVTPYVGVWIETYGLRNAIDYGTVTPYVGVWIETFMSLSSSGVGMSHPTWVCGLKLSGTIRT